MNPRPALRPRSVLGRVLLLFLAGVPGLMAAEPARFTSELLFPLHPQHNHAPGLVETPDGSLLASWYRGSGERKADDVAVFGAWRRAGRTNWSEPFLLADTAGFPDGNTALFVDERRRLWLFHPVILANTWESCLTRFHRATDFAPPGPPRWERDGFILLKPDEFAERARRVLDEEVRDSGRVLTEALRAEIATARERVGDKLHQRLGWQPRCKPTRLPNGRLLLPLYTDTFTISIMAISDDQGETWRASQPLLGFGNIQPAVLRRNDGTLVAYMRENGPRQKVRVAESKDDGETWGPVGVCDLANPGSGLDGVRLANGHWLLVLNDTLEGRRRLSVAVSTDEGRTWPHRRALEEQADGSYHYPAVIQARDGTVHVIYSYFVTGGKSMKHAAFNEAWIQDGAGR